MLFIIFSGSFILNGNHDRANERSSSSCADPGLRLAFKCLNQCLCPGWRHLNI